jgi:GNAT superfamily N-acetyltransferase
MAEHRSRRARIQVIGGRHATTVDVIDPVEIVGEAASVLQEAWSAPSLFYSADYLAWQFSFPSPLPRLGAVARESGAVVGFAGMTSRRVSVAGWTGHAAVVSFVAVRPSWRGQGIAGQLYASLLPRIRDLETPVVTFAEPEGIGERALLNAYDRASFSHHRIGPCQPYGCVARRDDPRGVARIVSAAELAPVVATADAGVRLAPNDAELRHFEADPRRRRAIVAEAPGSLAGALAVAAPMLTVRGLEAVLTVDVTFASPDRPELLRAIADRAATEFASEVSPMAIFPNAIVANDETARAAGLRKLPIRYVAHLCVPESLQSLVDARPNSTNVDVV